MAAEPRLDVTRKKIGKLLLFHGSSSQTSVIVLIERKYLTTTIFSRTDRDSMKMVIIGSPLLLALGLCALFIFGLKFSAQAQNQSQPTTDPAEARALNSIFQRWGISARQDQWNISGEPCSGAALDSDSTDIDNTDYNPFIKCDCSFNGSTCHITRLKVYARNVVGVIPDELWSLTFLTNLRLGQNYLTGPLSASIGNLTRMQWLDLGINALSGELPKEVGLLTDLRSFAIGTNNFSGPLPSELGNCSMLQQLYFDGSGISGEIPSTFANLQNLDTVWASDTELTGRIPDFIGNWSKLTVLRFQGNSFEGPIPSTFANLTSLTELDLRSNNISDTIPSSIGEYQSLTQLDLSFNNITGQIPDALFNLSSLTYLFLGNNKLNGTLPAEKSSSLRNIDVSYNNLAGSFPSWINQPNLLVNLVANNFTIGQSNSSVLPSGLNCLQRNFPCNRGSGIYYNFAIKCGGPQITSSDGTLFERDNETLGPASYYVTDTNRWAVSNVGYFTGTNNPQYTITSASQFTNTLDSELFQTARISASSLRYYGLGLENGTYTVRLQFAETQILDTDRWESRGRRVFDIYIQGSLVLEDFDIQKEAGGVSRRAVIKEFKALVSENYLEIHLFWAGKGTCCVPAQGTYGPSISAISAYPDFIPTVSNNASTSKKTRTGLIVGIVVGVGVVGLLFVAAFCIFRRQRARKKDDEELLGIDAKPYTFSYAELRAATEDFNPANKLGEGGFGPVYKGRLDDERVIAVKQLSVASRQGKSQFVTEIATISAVQHRNLVKLYGCCIEADQRLLVYEYLENKSLDQALFGKNLNLSWSTRYDICMGVARGLAYLHEESRVRIVHRDVKSSNILLDSDLTPKISDFGLAKLYDDNKTHISTRVAGTIGYLAPEYAMRGHLTEKTDVFAFGVVALEIVSGRPNSDSSLVEEQMYLLEWAWHLHEKDHEVELADCNLSEFNEEEMKRVIGIALLCTQTSPMQRPSMSRVVAMLSGDAEVSRVVSKPGYLTDWKFDDATSFTSNLETGASETNYDTSISTSIVADAQISPGNVTKPMLDVIIGDGR
ncbi:probable LRR receptor-like serine/threonine-protein kinase At1g56130 isoform X3 [Durio zibethinus]|uniref:non-specific serine/threonine protein kinase n=1 Tax=Durio zibethinus TaxID=66656 RepID=A0A6P5Z9E6_DURZI|nr:probable LRR receptor-like serine/threonine-protein kinase At1g56130 isoform X3 [Durio zibethinus]